MDKWYGVFSVLCMIGALSFTLWNRRKTKKTMDTIAKMLDAAMEGDYSEHTFDESRLSALETKFSQYLSASQISANNVAVEKDKIKTLIADISHQIKTPIANLLLYSELLEEQKLPSEAHDNAEALHSQAQKLYFLIDSLVKMSRMENGILTLCPHTLRLHPMLEKVWEQMKPKAKAKGLFLQLNQTAESAVFDPKWTNEAICNIVDNAIKYTEYGGVTISVQAYEMFVCIEITDTGIGIAEEEQARVFKRFYRSQEVAEGEGVGIGLYLAREIISGQGGYIKLSSSKKKGSSFGVFLQN